MGEGEPAPERDALAFASGHAVAGVLEDSSLWRRNIGPVERVLSPELLRVRPGRKRDKGMRRATRIRRQVFLRTKHAVVQPSLLFREEPHTLLLLRAKQDEDPH